MSDTLPDWLFMLQAFATFAMTGLIWFIQIVHYPLMRAVGTDGYAAYQTEHMRLTTLVVAPLMLLEAVTAVWLVFDLPGFVSRSQAWIGIGLVAAIWSSTVFLSVPRHEALRRGFDPPQHAALVATNWIRTGAWTGRSILLLVALCGARS